MNLVFLIDSTLDTPLFVRETNGKVLSNILNVNWYAEENRTFTVANDFFDRINKGEYVSKKQRFNKYIEVKMLDFKQFEINFWKRNKKIMKEKTENNNLNALVVGSEIMSYIKGSPTAFFGKNWHLSKDNYLNFVGKHKTFVSKNAKLAILEITQKYEEWKTEENYFDLMDIVSFLINEMVKVLYL